MSVSFIRVQHAVYLSASGDSSFKSKLFFCTLYNQQGVIKPQTYSTSRNTVCPCLLQVSGMEFSNEKWKLT